MNDKVSSWDFTMANYDAVWGFVVQFGLLLLFLMLGNVLRRKIPLFRNCLVPSALLGGTALLRKRLPVHRTWVWASEPPWQCETPTGPAACTRGPPGQGNRTQPMARPLGGVQPCALATR